MTTTKQRLALSILNFLSTSLTDGTLSPEDSDSIEIAQNCISDVFKVDPAKDNSAVKDTQSLLQIYTVYEKLKGKTPVNPDASASPSSTSATSQSSAPTDEQKKEAESLKSKGNAAMAQKSYKEAIDLYSQSLSLIPGNPIYLSNRAAAYSAAKDHESARADAEAATTADPKYTKAWSRLGLARFALGDARGSMEAYGRGIEEEKASGGQASEAMRKGWETAKRRVEEEDDGGEDIARDNTGGGAPGGGGMPDLSSLAGMFGGGGAGGGGGMPDLGAMMNNPMFKSMAEKVMSDPGMMANIMNNPKLREMAGGEGGAGGGGGGGGMPDLGSLMQDPAMMEMAKNLMGGGGAGRGRGQ